MNQEAKVLSAVLKDKQFHLLLQEQTKELFVSHADVWEFIQQYVFDNGTLPPFTLVEQTFPDVNLDEEVGSTKFHLSELKQEYLDMKLRETLKQAIKYVQDGDPTKALKTLVVDTSDIQRITTIATDTNALDVDAAVAHYERVRKLNESGSYGIRTGIVGFDSFLPGGILPGQFGIVMAYPGIGKSWIVLYFAIQAWLRGKTPIVVSLEMPESEVRTRLYTILGKGKFSNRRLNEGLVDPEEIRAWGKEFFKDRPPFIIVSNESGEVSTSTVRAKIHQYNPDFVMLDYAQLMVPDGKYDSEVTKMKNLSTEFKRLSLSEHIAVVAISSATPTADENGFVDMQSVPQLNQTAWSKQFAYDADWALALGRKTNSTIIECVFRKNRNGLLGDFLIDANFDAGIFTHKGFD